MTWRTNYYTAMRLDPIQANTNRLYYVKSNVLHAVTLFCQGTVPGTHRIKFQGASTNAFGGRGRTTGRQDYGTTIVKLLLSKAVVP